MMYFVRVRCISAAIACAALGLIWSAPATAQVTWGSTSAGTYTWSDTVNWLGGVAPGTTGTALFDNNIAGPLTVSTGVWTGTQAIGALAFDSTNAVTISSGTDRVLRISNGITVAAGTHTLAGNYAGVSTTRDYLLGSGTFSIASGAQLTISGRVNQVTSNPTYTKSGAGTLLLSGTNGGSGSWTFGTGSFSVSEGVLAFGGASNVTGNSGNRYSVSSGAAMELRNVPYATSTLTLNGDGIGGTGALRSTTGASSVIYSANSLVLGSNASIGVDSNAPLTIFRDITGAFNLSKVGSGTLTLSSTNAPTFSGTFSYTGTTSINAGTLQIGNNNTAGALSPSSVITGSAGATLAFRRTDTVTQGSQFASAIGGSINLTQMGSGTLVLNGANTYTGTTTASAGTLLLDNALALQNSVLNTSGAGEVALGSGSITTPAFGGLAGSTLLSTAINNWSQVTALTLNPAAGVTATYSGGINDGAANMTVTKTGAGTQVLSGSNSYTGSTGIAAGTLAVSSDSNLGTAPGATTAGHIVINGGALSATASFALDAKRGIALGPAAGSGTGTIDVAGAATSLSYAGIVADNPGGTGGLTKTGVGTLVLSATSTYSGNTTIAAGVLQVTGSLASPSVAVSGGATLGGTGAVNATTVADLGSLTPGTGSAGSGGIGTLSLGSLSFANSATINIGVENNATSSLLNVLGDVAASGGANTVTFAFGNSLSGINSGTYTLLAYGGTLTNASAFTYSGVTGARQAVSIANAGQALSLLVANAFPIWSGTDGSGWSTANNWVLSSNGSPTSFIANDAVVFDDAATAGAVTLSTDVNPISTTFSGTTLDYTLSSPGGFGIASGFLAKSGPAMLTISTSNSFSGGTTLSAGRLRVGSDAALGIGTVALNGGTLSSDSITPRSLANAIAVGGDVTIGNAIDSGTLTLSGGVDLGNATRQFTTLSDVTLSGAVANGSLTKAGPDMLVLSGSSSYTGGTTIDAGILQIGVGGTTGALSSTGVVTVNSGGKLQLYRGGTSSVYVFAAPLAGSGTVTLLGTGVQGQSAYQVTGSNSAFTGTFVVQNARLQIAATGTYAAGNAALIDIQSGGGLYALRSLSTPLTISGSGWSENAGYLGAIRVASNADLSGPITLLGDSRIQAGTDANNRLSGVISGSYAVEFSQGTITLSGSNTYSGGTRIGIASPTAATTIGLANVAAFGTGTVTVGPSTRTTTVRADVSGTVANALSILSGGTLTVDASSNALWLSGVISGDGGLKKTGIGSLTLTGNNPFSGPTAIDAGLVAVDGQLDGSVAVASGALVGGSGVIGGVLAGAGLVSPGNSPGILTAGQFDATSGLDAAFEFTALAPLYANATASANDVLRLTSGTPFTSSLGGGNAINVYFDVDSIAKGDVFEGGFFTSLSAADLLTAVENASFAYWIKDNAGATSFNGVTYSPVTSVAGITGVTVATVSRTADFGGGDVSGSVTQFIIVPEPQALALAGVGMAAAAWSMLRRRVAS